MEYRDWTKKDGIGRDISTSLLGYGCMRFPTLPDDRIDEVRAEKLLNTAREAGVNYFDTAFPYHGGESEPFVGRVIAKWRPTPPSPPASPSPVHEGRHQTCEGSVRGVPTKRVSPSGTCSASLRGAAPIEPKRPVGVSCEPGLPSDWELPNPTADSQVKQVSTRSSAMSSPLAHAGIHHAVQRAGYQVAGEHEGGGE